MPTPTTQKPRKRSKPSPSAARKPVSRNGAPKPQTPTPETRPFVAHEVDAMKTLPGWRKTYAAENCPGLDVVFVGLHLPTDRNPLGTDSTDTVHEYRFVGLPGLAERLAADLDAMARRYSAKPAPPPTLEPGDVSDQDAGNWSEMAEVQMYPWNGESLDGFNIDTVGKVYGPEGTLDAFRRELRALLARFNVGARLPAIECVKGYGLDGGITSRKNIEEYRREYAPQVGGRDCCEICLFCGDDDVAGDHVVIQQRTILGPPGTIERIAAEIDRLCNVPSGKAGA